MSRETQDKFYFYNSHMLKWGFLFLRDKRGHSHVSGRRQICQDQLFDIKIAHNNITAHTEITSKNTTIPVWATLLLLSVDCTGISTHYVLTLNNLV